MASTTPLPPATARPAGPAGSGARLPAAGRRRSVPWIILGVLLVTGCALAFGLVLLGSGQRQAVLAVARPVPAGQVLQPADLRVVRVSAGDGAELVPAGARARVVGRPAAVPLVPGALLSPAQLGQPAALPPGEALVALALRPGQFPPSLAPGARVLVASTGTAGGPLPGEPGAASGEALVPEAVVRAVDPPGGQGGGDATVVSVQVPQDRVLRVVAAAAAEQAALVLLPEARG